MVDFLTNFGIPIALILIAIAAFLSIVFPVIRAILNPKNAIKGVIGIVVILVIFFIVYSIAPGSTEGVFQKAKYAMYEAGDMKWIETGIITTLVFLAVAFVCAVVGEVTGFFK